MNAATLIVLGIVALCAAAAAVTIIRNKKKRRNCCSGGCDGCPFIGNCSIQRKGEDL